MKFKDELETIQYFTEGWNKNKYSEDKFHYVYYHRLCSPIKENHYFPEPKAKHWIHSLNESLLQLIICCKP